MLYICSGKTIKYQRIKEELLCLQQLVDFSELSKLLSVKSKVSADLLSLFGRFGLGRLLCRLSLEKHDGVSAVQLILSLCLFRLNGESVHSIYKKNFYELLDTGKNCYYRMLTRPSMDWRRLLNHMLLRFICILRHEGVWKESENSCLIIDDTTLEKTCIRGTGKLIRI